MTEPIYHLAYEDSWRSAALNGDYQGTTDDRRDGFLHFSTAAQVAESARRHRAGRRDILLIAVDPVLLGSALKWEPSRGGDLFPHLYGTLPMQAVLSAEPLPLGSDGLHIFPVNIKDQSPKSED